MTRELVGDRAFILSKIEKPGALQSIDEVMQLSDAIMVARGDLGVEMPLEQVPIVQKRAIKLARRNAKPVIVATQMLDSMMNAPRPTRAEASDVAYAVMDGADAVMLSGETSVGNYPIEAVSTMDRIACAAEKSSLHATHTLERMPETTGGAIARAAAEVGAIVGAGIGGEAGEVDDAARDLRSGPHAASGPAAGSRRPCGTYPRQESSRGTSA